jgi:hypothetical protein
MAERGHNLSEFRHRDLLAAEVVDPAQQHNVSGHASIMSKRNTHPACDFGLSSRSGPEPHYQLGNRPIGASDRPDLGT